VAPDVGMALHETVGYVAARDVR